MWAGVVGACTGDMTSVSDLPDRIAEVARIVTVRMRCVDPRAGGCLASASGLKQTGHQSCRRVSKRLAGISVISSETSTSGIADAIAAGC